MRGFVGEGKLLFDVGEGREHDLAEEGEGGGFARRDTVLGDGDKEFAEDVVDVSGGEEIAVEGGGNFVAQALRLEEFELLPGMESTEERMGRAAQHAAAAAVGEVKLAARGDSSTGIRVGHGNLLEVDLSYRQRGNESAPLRRLLKNPRKKQIPRYARDDNHGVIHNYGVFQQAVREPKEDQTWPSCLKVREGCALGLERAKK